MGLFLVPPHRPPAPQRHLLPPRLRRRRLRRRRRRRLRLRLRRRRLPVLQHPTARKEKGRPQKMT